MTAYRVVAEPRVEFDVAATFDWYEAEQAGLGREFVDELRATYGRVADGPLGYEDLRSGIRRALVRRFPYAWPTPWRVPRSQVWRFPNTQCTRGNSLAARRGSSPRVRGRWR